MCGFAGILIQSRLDSADQMRKVLTGMGRAIAHRGPDDDGVWLDEIGGIGFSHRRLSVIDLSPAGHQPLESRCGRFVIVYNGEIYNHHVIREELEKDRLPRRFAPREPEGRPRGPTFSSVSVPDLILDVGGDRDDGGEGKLLRFARNDRGDEWRGHSDTETLLAAIEAWGVEKALKKVKGMFAFALWDKQQKALYLARDRVGEKPLYYGWQGDAFLFGSELKALKASPDFIGEIDRGALALFLRHNYVPGPHSIYKGIKKLPAGTFLKIETGREAGIQKGQEKPEPYWDFAQAAKSGLESPFAGNESEAITVLEEKLGSAIAGQMLSDVPLGALLSGGVDSSLICALMQSQNGSAIKTFTIGFDAQAYNEAEHASAVAKHLRTEHTELYIQPDDALNLIPALPQMYDEPFADSSQLPTHLVMQMVKQHVTVALSGDGGDELFAGYNRYAYAPKIWDRLGRLPPVIRGGIAKALTAIPAAGFNQFANALGVAQLGSKAHKLGQRLQRVNSIDDLYLALVSEWGESESLVLGAGAEPDYLLNSRNTWPVIVDSVARMMVLDSLSYLPDDILVKVDRAAMAVSLETRAPFLDKDIIEFAWQLPKNMKIRDGQGKWLLRQLLDKYVPRELIERPKMGFSIPLDDWLRGPLKDWAEQLLDESRLRREGYLNPEPIRKAWHRHCLGKANYGYRLWSVLMFQSWLENERGAC
ncbi:MAG: asparagine synthase (glutamine-hydrolyzing) [Saprospiraceae bacterium]|jgi:asparagine synthase (glutamine-hydrolysing)